VVKPTGVFAKRLKALMKAKGLTKRGLARRSGLTLPAVSNLVKGTSQPYWDTVQRLAAVLGCSFDDLADPALRTPPPPPVRGKPGRPRKHPKPEESDEG
jgi:transcriptional regulator with XRE-family HTH domain